MREKGWKKSKRRTEKRREQRREEKKQKDKKARVVVGMEIRVEVIVVRLSRS